MLRSGDGGERDIACGSKRFAVRAVRRVIKRLEGQDGLGEATWRVVWDALWHV